jgi:hypothetical protein
MVLVALAVGSAPAAAQKEPKLTDFKSEKGGYQVKLPGTPKEDTKKVGDEKIPVTTARVEASSGAVYAASFAVYPKSYQNVPAKTILDGVRDGLKGTDGKLDEEEKELVLESGGEKYPGREVVVKAGRNYVRARVYLVGTTLYQVMVTGSKEAVMSTTAVDVLYSLRLTK